MTTTQAVKTVGLFLPNWVGDAVMATPAIRAIRRRFPRPTTLVGIMRPKMVELFAGTEWFDEIWPWEPTLLTGPHSQTKLVQKLRGRQLEILVLFTNSLRTALLAFLGRARRRVGYARDARSLLLTDKIYPRTEAGRIVPEPMVWTYLALAEAIGCPPESPHLELAVTPQEKRLAAEVLAKLGFLGNGPILGLVYAGAQGPARRWPVEYYLELARMVVRATTWQVLIIVGPDERSIGRQIEAEVSHPRVRSVADLPSLGLGLAKACLEACQVVISPDSGPRHIAAALGKPVITLYGPTDPIWGANPTVRTIDLFVELPCLGCLEAVCPLGHHKCMRELKPSLVFGAFQQVAEGFPCQWATFRAVDAGH
ncbi:MAG: lipopolysaccharide heptosyltransferase II [Thermoguttaceae bacterium]|nr:lipopolysaccharide heptosyltransferase II [Thermoguttaceae bacterium]